ncbi:hypothetical protein EW145_g7764, partial [Phellinidium pouzarii]
LSRRNETARAYRKHIPEFYIGSYENALTDAQREARPMTTLIDPEFNQILKDNHFLVWGGDARDYEASQASQKLGATTYPFVAFIALQARSGSRGSTNSPVLIVLSRHQGPSTSIDADASAPTSARTLSAHLTGSLLPRVSPFLTRLRSAHLERLAQRRLREEQDAAFARAAQTDRERIETKRAEEARAQEEIEMQEMRKTTEEEERRREREERDTREANKLLWYRYARKTLLPPEAAPGKGAVRIGVRLPDGRLQIRHFAPSDSVTSLYVFVAALLIPEALSAAEDPSAPPTGFLPGAVGVSKENWTFKLALAFPRREVPWSASALLSDVEGLHRGGQFVVESIPGHALIPGSGLNEGNGDSDYDTEEE